MSKPVINNRIIYNNSLGRITQHDYYLNQGVTTGDSPTFNDIFITGDASITGNLYVEGNTTILNTNVVEFEDNIILINRLETGSGVTLNQSGLEIERGTFENYRMVFNESDDTFRIGVISNTQAVATREDSPLLDGVMIWNNTTKRLDARNVIGIDLSLTSTTNSTSSSTGTLNISGGLGVNKDIYTSGKIYIRGVDNSKNSVIWTDTTNSANISSNASINFLPTVNLTIPYDKPLNFGTDNHKIVVNGLNNNMEISSGNDINFNLSFSKKITVPNGIPITFSTQNEKVYADNSNNMVIEGSQDINLIPGVNKKVLLNFDTPICFGNTNQKIYSTLIENLYVNAGNDIILTPSSTRNVVIPTDNGIKFGNSGLQRIYANSNNEFFIQSTNILTISVSSNNILLTGPTKLNFGNANQFIWGENSSGTLTLSAAITKIDNTAESNNVNTGALIINGGVGIGKNLNVGGNMIIGGDLTVSGVTTTLNTETVLLEDNMIVLNNGPSPLSDGGLLIKKYQSGSAGSVDYAGIFYKQSVDKFVLARTLSDPGQTHVIINNYLPLDASNLFLTSTENASGLHSGGSLTVSGGAAINKRLYVGENIYLPNANSIILENTNGNITTINTHSTSGNFILNSDKSIVFNGNSLSVLNVDKNLFNIDPNGNCNINGTANASGLNTGGSLTISGGCSIAKDFYIGGKGVIYNTTPSLNPTTGSLVLFGGLSVVTNENGTYGNGGGLTLSGGIYIEKDLYLGGNIYAKNSVNEMFSLTLTSTQPAVSSSGSLVNNGGILIKNTSNCLSMTNGGSLLSYGGASINKDLRVGGDLYVSGKAQIDNKLDLSGGILFETITNLSGVSKLWTYLGTLDNFSKLRIVEKGLTINVDLFMDNTTPNFSYSKQGEFDIIEGSNVYVYTNNGNYHIFLHSSKNSQVNLFVENKDGLKFILNEEGVGILPNGNTSGFTESWVKNWSTENETNINYSIGDLKVEGELVIYDNVPIIGSQDSNSNKVQSRDLGFIFQRSQESNETGSGDIVTNDSIVFTDTIPLQTGVNEFQVVFSNAANSNNNYYLNWWIKTTDNQVRKITSYNGSLRAAQIDKAWVTQPQNGDVLYFYNTQLPSIYWDESDKTFSLSYVGKDTNTLLNNGNISLRAEKIYLTNTNSSVNGSSGSIFTLGGVSISNTTDGINCSNGGSLTTLGGIGIGKSLYVGNTIYIGANSTSSNESLTINQTTSSLVMYNTSGSYSSILFAGDKINKKYGIVNDNSDNLFSITYSSGNETPDVSPKSFVINSDGNVGLKTTQNMNSLLNLKDGNFISSDGDLEFIGLRGSTNETAGSRIILTGNGSTNNGDLLIYGGGTGGSLKIYTQNVERANVNSDGVFKLLTNNVSSNSSTGSFVINGGISINNTTNASNYTNGGSLTTDGGVAVKKDVYIGGDIYINGNINTNGGVLSPNITISDTVNCSVISIEKSSLIKINNQVLYTVSVILNPIESSQLTEFQFEMPERSSNFTKINDINIQCNGFTGDETTLFNMTGLCVATTKKCKIKFQSASTGLHYIQIMSRYSV